MRQDRYQHHVSRHKGLVLGSALLVFALCGLTISSIIGIVRQSDAAPRSPGSNWLVDLPIPIHAAHLDAAARYRLLFRTPAPRISPDATQAAGHQSSSGGSTLSSALTPTGARDGPTPHPHSRLVVLPDLHGDAHQALAALQLARLVSPNLTSAAANDVGADAAINAHSGEGGDSRNGDSGGSGSSGGAGARPETWSWEWRWIGGDALLVQLGDVVDRGPDSLMLLGALERLKLQARAAGGDVVLLLGNHELMNVHHDFRYISRTELQALAEAGGLPPLWPGAAFKPAATSSVSGTAGRLLAGQDGSPSAPPVGSAAPFAAASTAERDMEDASLRAESDGNVAAAQQDRFGGRDRGRELLLQGAGCPDGSSDCGGGSGGSGGDGNGEEGRLHKQPTARDTQQLQRKRRRRRVTQAVGRHSALPRGATDAHGVPTGQGEAPQFGRADPGAEPSLALTQRHSMRRTLAVSRGADGRSGGGSADNAGSARASRSQQQRQELLVRGLGIWQAALAADQPLGALIRSRPLAALVDAGGCRLLAVHAGAFPWMLDAVDALVAGAGPRGSMSRSAAGAGAGSAAEAAEAAPPALRPVQYVEAWNAAVAAALRDCEGRTCAHGRGAAAGAVEDGTSANVTAASYERHRLALADLLLGGEGAVWSRRYDRANAQQVCGEVSELVRRLGVQQLVVGHTVQPGGRVSSRCGGKLLMADVGLSRAIAGRMAVLECAAGRMRPVYG